MGFKFTTDIKLNNKSRSVGFVQNVPQTILVSTRGIVGAEGSNISSPTFDKTFTRIRHRFGRASPNNIRALFWNGGLDTSQGDWIAGPPVVLDAAIERANVAVKVVASAVAVPSGGIVLSDPVVPADLGLGSFGANATLMSRNQYTLDGTETVWGGFSTSVTTAGSAERCMHSAGQASPVNAIGDPSTAGWNGAPVYGIAPLGLIGTYSGARDHAIGILMDSFGQGAGEANAGAQTGEGQSNGGFAARALWGVGGANATVPWVKLARGGATCTRLLQNTSYLQQIFPYLTRILCNFFYNDAQSLSLSQEVILANLITLGKLCNSFGLPFDWCRPFPACTSSDNFQTVGGQTVVEPYATKAAFVVAGMIDAYADGELVGSYIDNTAAVRHGTETNKWLTDEVTPNLVVATDNTHCNANGHSLAAAAINAHVAALPIPGA